MKKLQKTESTKVVLSSYIGFEKPVRAIHHLNRNPRPMYALWMLSHPRQATELPLHDHCIMEEDNNQHTSQNREAPSKTNFTSRLPPRPPRQSGTPGGVPPKPGPTTRGRQNPADFVMPPPHVPAVAGRETEQGDSVC